MIRHAHLPSSRVSAAQSAAPTLDKARHEQGVVGGVEVLPFGFLVFVTGALLLANAWAVVDAKLAVGGAAREGARAYVEADDGGSASANALTAARQAVAGAGRDPSKLGLTIDAPRFARCAVVTVTAEYHVPSLRLPFIGGVGPGFEVRGRHRELVDPFADGAPAANDCGF